MSQRTVSQIRMWLVVLVCAVLATVGIGIGLRYRANVLTERILDSRFRNPGIRYSVDGPDWVENVLERIGVKSRGDKLGVIVGVPEFIFLDEIPLTTRQKQHLQQIAGTLSDVLLWTSNIADEDLAWFADNRSLKSLYIEANIRGSGLEHLQNCTRLEDVGLRDTGIDDDDVYYLLGLKGLKSMDLRRTANTATGVERLAELPALERLVVLNCLRLDVQMVQWNKFRNLQSLCINDYATSNGFAQIKAALPPTCKLVLLPPFPEAVPPE